MTYTLTVGILFVERGNMTSTSGDITTLEIEDSNGNRLLTMHGRYTLDLLVSAIQANGLGDEVRVIVGGLKNDQYIDSATFTKGQ